MTGSLQGWRERAPAKINLALQVTGRRPDGFHTLDTLVAFADFGDTLDFSRAGSLQLTVTGPFSDHAPGTADDLAARAARVLCETAGIGDGVAIQLRKNIPAGAGLGGGSADAAAVLRGLNALWGLGFSTQRLVAIGRPLGADVPMCVHSKPLRATGTGEIVREITLPPNLPLLLVWPGKVVSTAAVFSELGENFGAALPEIPNGWPSIDAFADWLAQAGNNLEAPAIRLEPEIGKVRDAIAAEPGCRIARMTGSGSACFGLFSSAGAAARAGAAIAKNRPHWWVRPVFLPASGIGGQ
ncbi:MAG: 4-(cytidine 5'-diphospho)-2-C-methyl-D-erythritol kinase [Alphaproteobacteria bacterium]